MFGRILSIVSVSFILAGAVHAEEEKGPPTPEQIVRIPTEKEQKKVKRGFGPDFRVMETDHFRVISDCSFRYQLVVNGVLEQFYLEFHPRFFKKKMKQVSVYLIHGGEEFDAFVAKKGHEWGKDNYGFYIPKERVIYARHYFPDGKVSGVGTLFHMAVHPMIDADFRKEPPDWFSTGLCCLCERGRILKGRWVYGNPNPWREADFRPYFERGDSPDLKTLLTLSDEDFRYSASSHVYYHATRSFFLYLLRKDEKQLVKFVDLIRRGNKGPKAAEAATGMTLKEVEKEWEESIFTVNFAGDYAYRAEGDEAKEILMEGLEEHPDDGYLHYLLADILADEDQNTKAAIHAKAALKDPRLIYPHFAYQLLGQAYLFGKATKAIEAFQTAITYQPWEDFVMEYSYKKLVYLLKAKKREEEAAAVLKELAQLKEEDKREK